MERLMNYPLLICVLSVVCLWAAAWFGVFLRKRKKGDEEILPDEFGTILGAILTLLGLLIGFSFSMAISRYDLRKAYEEEEANAIGTEYLRADLLPDAVRVKVKQQLVQYLDLRVQKYEAHASQDTTQLDSETGQLQNEMWNQVSGATGTRTDPVMASVVTGMNDVINRQGYTQAARWNRIPLPAWGLMVAIALFCNFLIGYGEKEPGANRKMLLIVPLAISVSFLLIADIDSPQGGLIRVAPQNLISLADSLRPK
jgi:hypothetical protein